MRHEKMVAPLMRGALVVWENGLFEIRDLFRCHGKYFLQSAARPLRTDGQPPLRPGFRAGSGGRLGTHRNLISVLNSICIRPFANYSIVRHGWHLLVSAVLKSSILHSSRGSRDCFSKAGFWACCRDILPVAARPPEGDTLVKNEAIGSYEAAAVMGLHFTRPRRMAEAGIISSTALGGEEGRSFSVYSLRECDENFRDYEETIGKSGGRPRTQVDSRHAVLRVLADKDRPVIMMDDVIGTQEAAEILGVWHTLVPRLVKSGRIVGRLLWSERASASRLWIFSRKSCEACVAKMRKLEEKGISVGRPRIGAVEKKE